MHEGGLRVIALVLAFAIVGFGFAPSSPITPFTTAEASDPGCAGVDPQTGDVTVSPEHCTSD